MLATQAADLRIHAATGVTLTRLLGTLSRHIRRFLLDQVKHAVDACAQWRKRRRQAGGARCVRRLNGNVIEPHTNTIIISTNQHAKQLATD